MAGHFPQSEGPEDYNEMRPPHISWRLGRDLASRGFSPARYTNDPQPQVQENVLYAVQGELMRRGFFRGMIDGRPGPATSDAILRLQQEEGLPVSGRLDNETLNELRAFPGQRNGPPEEGFRRWPGRQRIYRDFPEPF